MPYGVGLLGIALPERSLLEGDRRVLGIGADRADDDGLVDTEAPCRIEHVGAHQQVVEVQIRRPGHVGADSAGACRQVDDELRSVLLDHGVDLVDPAEIDLGG